MARFELISILIAVVGVGAVLAGLVVNGQSTIRAEAHADRAEARAAREQMQAEARTDRAEARAAREQLQAEARTDRAEARAAREQLQAEARTDRAEARAAWEQLRVEARADRVQFQTEIKRLLERQGKVEGLVEGLTLVTPLK